MYIKRSVILVAIALIAPINSAQPNSNIICKKYKNLKYFDKAFVNLLFGKKKKYQYVMKQGENNFDNYFVSLYLGGRRPFFISPDFIDFALRFSNAPMLFADRQLRPTTILAAKAMFKRIELDRRQTKKRKLQYKKETGRKTKKRPYALLGFFVIRGSYKNKQRATSFLLNKTYELEKYTSIDNFYVSTGCRIIRTRIGFEVVNTFTMIDEFVKPKLEASCIATAYFVHYGFSNPTAIIDSDNPKIVFKSKSYENLYVLNLGVIGFFTRLYGGVGRKDGLKAGLRRCEVVAKLAQKGIWSK